MFQWRVDSLRVLRVVVPLLLISMGPGCIEDPESIVGADAGVEAQDAASVDAGADADARRDADVDSVQCDVGMTSCSPGEGGGGACVDLDTDDDHCGVCDNSCAPAHQCRQGTCVELDEVPGVISGVDLWLRADRDLLAYEQGVRQWQSQPNSETVATQTDPGSRPRFVEDTLADKPTIRFDGAGHFLDIDGYVHPAEQFSTSFVFVPGARIGAGGSPRQLLSGGTEDGDEEGFPAVVFNRSGNAGVSLQLGSDPESTADLEPAFATWHSGIPRVVTISYDGVDARLYVDGELHDEAPLSPGEISDDGLQLGGVNGERHFSGDLAELVIVDRNLDDDELDELHRYFFRRYHFYYDAAAWPEAHPDEVVDEIEAFGLSEKEVQDRRFQKIPAQNSCSAHIEEGRFLDGRYLIVPDGVDEPFAVYCDMERGGGGWQLISVVRNDDNSQVIVDDRFCLDLSTQVACKGRIHPQQVSAEGQVLVVDEEADQWLYYEGFSASNESALRYFSRQRELTNGDDCGEQTEHICAYLGNPDPELSVGGTSGFEMNYNPPLQQWWRWGGWTIGAEPGSGIGSSGNGVAVGRIHSSAYGVAYNVLRDRTAPLNDTELVGNGHQSLWYREAVQ